MPDSAEISFQRSYQKWGGDYLLKEINEGFHHIKLIKTSYVNFSIEFLANLKKSDQVVYARALGKRGKPEDWLKALGMSIMDEEGEAIQAFERASSVIGLHANTNSYRAADMLFRLKESIGPVLGEPKREERDCLEYRTREDEYILTTTIDFGGRRKDLVYHHYVYRGDERVVDFPVSILAWTGLSAATRMDGITNDNMMDSIKAVVVAIEEFRRTLPVLK